MMRRVWAAVLAVWATLAIVAVLSWTHPPVNTSQAQPTSALVLVHGKNGSTHYARVVVLPSGTPAHTTTGPSAVAGPSGATQLVSSGTGVTVLPSTSRPVVTTGAS